MKLSEAKELIHWMLIGLLRFRGITLDMMPARAGTDEIGKQIVGESAPYTFDEFSGKSMGLVDILYKMKQKGDNLERIDLFNAFNLAYREPAPGWFIGMPLKYGDDLDALRDIVRDTLKGWTPEDGPDTFDKSKNIYDNWQED